MENLTRVLSIEWARFGIRLTAVAPGPMATETMMTKYPKPVVEGVAGTVPLGRMGTEEEFAWLVAYIASPAGDYLSGAILTLDGARDNWFGPWPPRGLVERGGQAALRGEATEGVSEVPELRTERLLMRGWRFEDYAPLAEILADPAVGAGVGKPAGFTPHEAWLDLSVLSAHWSLRGFGHWALEERDSGELVGRAGLYYPPDWPGMEVGWTVARKHWGKGYAPEAARAACTMGPRRAGRAAHRQPDPSVERAVDPRRREAGRDARGPPQHARIRPRRLRHGSAPERFTPLTGGYTAAHDDDRRDA